jgi:hypothetical protein
MVAAALSLCFGKRFVLFVGWIELFFSVFLVMMMMETASFFLENRDSCLR